MNATGGELRNCKPCQQDFVINTAVTSVASLLHKWADAWMAWGARFNKTHAATQQQVRDASGERFLPGRGTVL